MTKEQLLNFKGLKEQISGIEKLSITEAQELYKKAVAFDDEKLKKIYMDKLILGTLYVIYDYIERNQIDLFKSAVYGVEDIVSVFTEVWIEMMYSGDILNVTRFSFITNMQFFNNACKRLCGEELIVNDIYYLTTEKFIEAFFKYLEAKNNGQEITKKNCNEYLLSDAGRTFYDDGKKIIETFEGIYKNLELDKIDDLEFSKTKIHTFLKLILSIGLTEPLLGDYVGLCNFEDKIVNKVIFEKFTDYIDSKIESKVTRDIIHRRFGLDDGRSQTLQEVARAYKVSQDRIRQIEARCLRNLRKPSVTKNLYRQYY